MHYTKALVFKVHFFRNGEEVSYIYVLAVILRKRHKY